MSRCVVVLMLPYVGGELRVHNPAERHNPEREPADYNLSNSLAHKALAKSRCLHRLMFLNSRNGFFDLLFGEQATFDVFLHASLLVNEDAHG